MPEFTQENAPFRLETELGPDVLLLRGFRGTEAISRPFRFDLDLLSLDADLDPEDILRTGALIRMELSGGEERLIHGTVSRFTQLGMRDEMVLYRAEIVPWLWFLGLSRESRIFQEMTVREIVEDVFERMGYADFDVRLTRSYPKRTFCVQYRESHLAFVSRLLEAEGIYYYFEHTEDKHVLVLTDYNASSQAGPGVETLRFVPDIKKNENVVTELEREHGVSAGKVTLWDYNFETPTTKLDTSMGDEHEEVYDYPGLYGQRDEGERLARLALEAEEAERQLLRGVSNSPGLTPGHHFSLAEHFHREANDKYLVTQVQHTARAGDFLAGGGEGLRYTNEFRAVPHDTPYRPRRTTPRPMIHGSQTALVVGPAGEEVYMDKYGRIKVQFHWDREGQKDENSSCWIRVATPWGGKGYGSISVPRIGNEVVVAFEEGDPDRPLVLASVYNADQMPPFGLPGAGIQMGMKSRSSPGGGGANEITMTDTKGSEMMNIHAQYDQVTTVQNDQTNTINNNRTTAVAVDDSESVGSNQTIDIGADQATTVGGNQTLEVGGNQEVTVGGNADTSIGGNESVSVGGNRETSVGGNEELSVGGNQKMGAGGNAELSAGANYTIKGGANIELDGGAKVTIKAGAMITLEAGGSKVEIGPAGVTIQTGAIVNVMGATIKLN